MYPREPEDLSWVYKLAEMFNRKKTSNAIDVTTAMDDVMRRLQQVENQVGDFRTRTGRRRKLCAITPEKERIPADKIKPTRRRTSKRYSSPTVARQRQNKQKRGKSAIVDDAIQEADQLLFSTENHQEPAGKQRSQVSKNNKSNIIQSDLPELVPDDVSKKVLAQQSGSTTATVALPSPPQLHAAESPQIADTSTRKASVRQKSSKKASTTTKTTKTVSKKQTLSEKTLKLSKPKSQGCSKVNHKPPTTGLRRSARPRKPKVWE
jgi:hypothetical protein